MVQDAGRQSQYRNQECLVITEENVLKQIRKVPSARKAIFSLLLKSHKDNQI